LTSTSLSTSPSTSPARPFHCRSAFVEPPHLPPPRAGERISPN
jgi:hypothetical protein